MGDLFYRKGEGRIVVKTEEDIKKVEKIIMDIDEGEFDIYYPKGLVSTSSQLIYNGKFELDEEDFYKKCFEHNIPVLVLKEPDNFY